MSARLFVALDVEENDRAALAEWAREAVGDDPGLRLVEPERIHLTLAFLGHRSLDDVQPLSALVAGLEVGAAFRVPTAGALWLSPRRPHVLTVALGDPEGRLAGLYDLLWTQLEEEFDLERERRRFRPHLTVARVRGGWTAPSRKLPAVPSRDVCAQALTLYRSYLGGRGPARYEAQVRAPLAAGS